MTECPKCKTCGGKIDTIYAQDKNPLEWILGINGKEIDYIDIDIDPKEAIIKYVGQCGHEITKDKKEAMRLLKKIREAESINLKKIK